MKLLNWLRCFCIAIAGGALFLLTSAIDAMTYAAPVPEFAQTCMLSSDGKRATVTCGEHETRIVVASKAHAALKATSIPVACRGYRTRGVFSGISLECGD